MSVIFIHGVTVRKEQYEKIIHKVRAGVTKKRAVQVEGFYWGEMASSLRYHGTSIPGFQEDVRAFDSFAVNRMPLLDQDQLKALLLDEPYLELTALQDAEKFDPSGRGFDPLPSGIEQRNQQLHAARPRVASALQQDEHLPIAMGKVATNDTLQRIVQNAFEQAGRADRRYSKGDLIDPLTRCLTAALYQAAGEQTDALEAGFSWIGVEEQVQRILEYDLGDQRGLIGDRISNVVLPVVTMALRQGGRQRIMKEWSRFIGDVLVYQTRRDEILQQLDHFVESTAKRGSEPLWLMGHSLGGIICYDYCCQTERNVERLITVGSQVGLFGEFGILKDTVILDSGKIRVPDRIKNWINIYDLDDMLSFLAAPVFSRVIDIAVDTTAPFPISHSEYWNCAKVYEILTEEFPEV